MEQCAFRDEKVNTRMSDLARLHCCSGLDAYITETLELELQCQLHFGILMAATVRALGVPFCLTQLESTLTNDEATCEHNRLGPNHVPGHHERTSQPLELKSTSSQHTGTPNEMPIDPERSLSCLTSINDDSSTENWDDELVEAHSSRPMTQPYHHGPDYDWDQWDDHDSTTDQFENIVSNNETKPKSEPRNLRPIRNTSDFTWVEPNSKRLFVKNISYRCVRKEFRDFFKQFGPVDDIRLMEGRNGTLKGTAFVTFKSEEIAVEVLGLPDEDLTLKNRVMEVKLAGFWKAKTLEATTAESNIPSQVTCLVQSDNDLEENDGLMHIHHLHDGLMHIHDLNDDVMLRVFGWLTLIERLQSERVCKRWRDISIMHWRTTEHLKFSSIGLGQGALTNRGLCTLLKRGSVTLKSLDLSLVSRQLTDASLAAIGRLCPNLIRLNATGVSAMNWGLRQFAQSRPQIQWISLRDCPKIGEDGLWWLFHRCKELRYVDLTGNKRINGKCVHMLSRNVETLILNSCNKLQDRVVDKIVLRCPTLTELQLNGCTSLTDHSISVLAQHLHSLAAFHLCGIFYEITSVGLRELGKLDSLQELHLKNNSAVDDDVLAVIGRGCKKLRILDLTSCTGGVTDAGLVSLSRCPMLHDLSMSYLHKITDDGLGAIIQTCRLTRLVVRCCGDITDSAMQLLSITCLDLGSLDVSGNLQISNATLHAFLDSVDVAPDRRIDLYIGGTSITSDDVAMSDNVTLHSTDLSTHHFRQDQDLSVYLDYDDADDIDQMKLYDDDDNDVEDDVLEDLQRQNECQHEGAATERVMHVPSMETAEMFLECDDPLAEEDWNFS